MSKKNHALHAAVIDGLQRGLTYGQIAELAGSTRSAVAGVAFRLNIKTERKKVPPKEPSVTIFIPNDPPLAGTTPTSLLDTTGCRWPVEGGFCNCPIQEKSYCPTHFAKAYRSAPDDLLNKLPFSTKNPKIQSAMHFYIKEGFVAYRRLDSGAYRYSMKTPPV